jgi:hypothetical protein
MRPGNSKSTLQPCQGSWRRLTPNSVQSFTPDKSQSDRWDASSHQFTRLRADLSRDFCFPFVQKRFTTEPSECAGPGVFALRLDDDLWWSFATLGLTTILNRCPHFRGFVYEHARF